MKLIDANKLIIDILTHDLIGDDEQVDKIILNAPTVEAIPIEWIEKYMDKVDVEDYGMVYLSPRGPFKKMLKDWEKENETN